MKIAIATNKGGLEDNISPTFGRCPTYTITEATKENITTSEVIENKFAAEMGGAGIQAAQFIVNLGADAAISGNFGPNAAAILTNAGVKMISAQGKVTDVIKSYLSGEIKPVTAATVPSHGGLGMSRGMMAAKTQTKEKKIE